MSLLSPLLLAALASALPHNGWQATLDEVVPAVVVVRVNAPRAFDDVSAGYQTATGFVVDAERGLLLTNRHVVMPGPVVRVCVLSRGPGGNPRGDRDQRSRLDMGNYATLLLCPRGRGVKMRTQLRPPSLAA